MELVPEEDPWIEGQEWADDAAAAVAYSLCTRQNGKSQDAVWAAQRVYEALDRFVINNQDIDTNIRGAEEQVLSNPLIQDELMRQQRDLRELAAVDIRDQSAIAIKMRQRARAEFIDVFEKNDD